MTVVLELIGGPLCGQKRIISAARDGEAEEEIPCTVRGCVCFAVYDGGNVSSAFYRVDPEFWKGWYVEKRHTKEGGWT